MKVYVETGSKRVFAVAVDWPGWARGAREEASAVEALIEYGERYRAAVGRPAAGLKLPRGTAELKIVERLSGGSGTDYGVPGVVPELDRDDVTPKALDGLLAIHEACWAKIEAVAAGATGKTLGPSGPRGGGRSLAKIVAHVSESEAAYIGAIGVKFAGPAKGPALMEAFASAVRQRAAGELPDVGPRGGARWPARYAIRRACWHLLDHAWEIEDRLG